MHSNLLELVIIISFSQTQMIRNKYSSLIQNKQKQQGRRFTTNRGDILQDQPWWFEQYYDNRQTLEQISANNKNINLLSRQYQTNPSVYSLKQIQKLITENCKLVQQVDQWVSRFRYSTPGTELYRSQKSMTENLQNLLAQQIMSIFSSKQLINSVNNQLNHQASLSRSRAYSQNNSNIMSNDPQSQDRNRLFHQVNSKIQDLNIVLRRMNHIVVGQGDLVNRIDENLTVGQGNMVKANQQLQRRVDTQEGSGQFSCEGKINKVITTLYVVNVVLIIAFFIKHIIL